MISKILLDLLCGALFSLGGWGIIDLRRFVMPGVLAISTCLFLNSLWPLLMVASMGTLCLGYFGKYFWGRGSWLALQALAMGLGLFLTHHLALWVFVPYIAICGLLAGFLYGINQLIGDAIFGVAIGSILFLVR